jgi:uncharacterized membrane protein YphA (DoxX/SURF4 family)
MTSLDWLMQYLAAGVFLCIGIRTIAGYRRRPKTLGAMQMDLPLGLPYGFLVAAGLFEIVAAMAMVMPFSASLQSIVVRLAAAVLALMMTIAGVYRMRRNQSAAPSVVLFLLALFVIVGRSI